MEEKLKELSMIQASIVIAAQDHNPAILNKDFLEANGIVDKQWGWVLGGDPSLSTPVFASVSYNSGVVFRVLPNRLELVDTDVEEGVGDSRVPQIAQAYINTLPHVRYTAVGNNFRGFVPAPDPDRLLRTRFLKEGEWASALAAIGLRLVYAIARGRAVLSLDSGEAARIQAAPEEKTNAVVVDANYHRECVGEKRRDEAASFINLWRQDWEHFVGLLRQSLRLIP